MRAALARIRLARRRTARAGAVTRRLAGTDGVRARGAGSARRRGAAQRPSCIQIAGLRLIQACSARRAARTRPGCGRDGIARSVRGNMPALACIRLALADVVARRRFSLARGARTGALGLLGSIPATAATTAESVRNYPSEIELSADGRFLYVANRGADCITAFEVADDGTLRVIADVPSGGTWPRHFA